MKTLDLLLFNFHSPLYRSVFTEKSLFERQHDLHNTYGFICKCEACVYEEAGKQPIRRQLEFIPKQMQSTVLQFTAKLIGADDKGLVEIAIDFKEKLIEHLKSQKSLISYTLCDLECMLRTCIVVLAHKKLMSSIITKKH